MSLLYTAKFRRQETINVGGADPVAFLITTDNGSSFSDFTSQVTDGNSGTHAPLDALDTLANGDFLIVRFGSVNIKALAMTLDTNFNGNASTLTVEFWNGTAWTSVSNLSDGTDSGGATFGQSGTISFNYPDGWEKNTVDGVNSFHLRLSVSAALSSPVDLAEIEVRGRTELSMGSQDRKNRILLMVENHSTTPIYWGDENVLPGDVAQVDGGTKLAELGSVTIDKVGRYNGPIYADVGSTETGTALVSVKDG